MNPLIKKKLIMKESLRSSYDSLVAPPQDYLASIKHIVTHQPKNFTTLCIDELEAVIINQLSISEPLINQLSSHCRKRLGVSIKREYYGTNIQDVAHGGLGLIVPTFIEIMSDFIFWSRDRNLKDLQNEYDKQFYSKYFWCFELNAKVLLEHNNKVA